MIKKQLIFFLLVLLAGPFVLYAQSTEAGPIRSVQGVVDEVLPDPAGAYLLLGGDKIFVEQSLMDDVGFIAGDKIIAQVVEKEGIATMVGYEFDFSQESDDDSYDDSSMKDWGVDDYEEDYQTVDERDQGRDLDPLP